MVDESSPRYPGWRVAGASAVGVFVSFASLLVYTFGIFLKPLAEEFSWSREAVSAAFGVAAMTVAVVSPGLGYLFDRVVDPRRIIVPSIIVFGGAFASLSLLTSHLWHLYAVFLVLGVVGNGTAQMAYSRAVSSWFTARRGMALAIVMAGGAVGSMVLPPVAETLVAEIGWRTAAVVLGAMVLGLGLPVVLAFVRQRAVAPDDAIGHNTGSLREGLTSRVFWILVIVLFFSSVAQNGALTHMAALLTDRGVAPSSAAVAMSAMGAASLAGRLLTSWLLDRFFAARVSFVMLSLAALGTLLLATAESTAAGAIAAALIGLGMGAEADVTPYMLSRYFGLRSFSTLYGCTYTAYAFAGALGPVLMGKAFDATGSYAALLTQLAFVTFAAAALMLLMPRYPALSREPGIVALDPRIGEPDTGA